MNEKFQILSLSGGGYRGLYTIAILAELEEKANRPLAKCFDLIAGTSIGGIIGLSLALERPMADVLKAFRENGTKIFSKRSAPKTSIGKTCDLFRFALCAKYHNSELMRVVNEMLGENTLLGDATHPIIVPTINVSTGRPQFFKTAHHESFRTDWKVKVADIAMATSAAPTFFPLASIGDSYYADGGLYANSPDIYALHEATHFFKQPEASVHVLSIGTTTSGFSFSHKIGKDLGFLKWMIGNRLISVILSSQQQCEEYMMKHKLQDRYIRIDEIPSKEQQEDLGLDVATKHAQGTLAALGKESAKIALGNNRIIDMLSYSAKEPIFFHNLSKRGE